MIAFSALLGQVLAVLGWGPARSPYMNVHVAPASPAADSYRAQSGAGADLTLRYFGGKTIPDLVFVNLFVGGENRWQHDDIARINWALLEAMTDAKLDRVLLEYFAGPISARCGGSQILQELAPDVVYKDTVESWLAQLFAQGALVGHDFSSTAFDFLLPPGVELVDGLASDRRPRPDSAHGLAGYHGSIHASAPDGSAATLYYTVAVYSQASAAGTSGIVAFSEPWKNVVATLYHELQEVRTDPDVADALAAPTPAGGEHYLGWASSTGAELGDLPLIASGGDLGQVMKEVPLANGQGTVPIQVLWSNSAGGPADVAAEAASFPLDMLAVTSAGEPQWDWPNTRAWIVHYLAWDGHTPCKAVIVLPSSWQPNDPPLPLVISPHGRNNFAWNNAYQYWRDLPARGPFALICPDGLSRAHNAASDPFDRPPDPTLFTYGYRNHIDDLARMPKIARDTISGLNIDTERVYVLGSSMGGQETLLLAAQYPHALSGGYGRLAGAAAFDAACDLASQCGYLTQARPSVAGIMIEEVGTRPTSRAGWNEAARFWNQKARGVWTIGQLLKKLGRGQRAWDSRSPIGYVGALANLPFPLRIYWSATDGVVANQASNQSGKLYRLIMASNPGADVVEISGYWAHSVEFVPDQSLGSALTHFGLIPP
jgi:pimeloyl-ACP methyl ester carboxylesterase